MDVLSGLVGLFLALIGFALSIAILLAQLRLFSIDKTLKGILAELRKGSQPDGPPASETEAELQRRRAAMREAQENWPTYK
jgi:hypothetical protein